MLAAPQSLDCGESPPARKRVVGLIRVSTAGQAKDDRGGIPRQRRVIEETIRLKNLDCIRTYVVSDCSGTQVLVHPDIQQILKLIASRVATGLVVADLDRLFRPDQMTDYAILQSFKDTGAIIYSGDTEYDLTNRDSTLFAGIRSAISGFELSLMKERQQGAKEAKRRAGQHPSNDLTLPLGVSYDRKQQKFFYNERISTVVEVFRLYDQGVRNYCELARRTGLLNVTIKNILRNPIYTGWRVINQRRGEKKISRTGKLYRKKTDRKEEEVIRVKVIDIPAVSQECFDRVQAAMAETRYNHLDARKRDEVFNFGTGVARCGHCGEILLASSGKKSDGSRHGYYQCKGNYYLYKKRLGGCRQPHVRVDEIDELIEAFASHTLTDPKTLTALVEGSLQRASEIISPFPQANEDDQIKAVQKRERRLLDAYEGGVLTLEELRTRREELRKEAATLRKKQAEMVEKPTFQLADFVRLVVRGALRLKRIGNQPANRREKKLLIMELFSEIHIRDSAIVSFKFRAGLPLGDSISDLAKKAPIHLDTPFTVRQKPAPAPAGHKRCSCCQTVLPVELFFPKRGECKECVKGKAHAAHLRRKAKKLSTGQ